MNQHNSEDQPFSPVKPGDRQREVGPEDGEAVAEAAEAAAQPARQQLVVDVEDDVGEEQLGP